MPDHYDPNRERERGAGLLHRTARFLRSRDAEEFTPFDRRVGRFFKEIISPTPLNEVLNHERDDSSIVPERVREVGDMVQTRIGAAFAPVRDLVRRGQEVASPTVQIAAARELGRRGLEGAGRMMAENPLEFLGPGAAMTAPMRPLGMVGRGMGAAGSAGQAAGRGAQAGRVASSSDPSITRAVPDQSLSDIPGSWTNSPHISDPVHAGRVDIDNLAETIATTPGSKVSQNVGAHGQAPPSNIVDPAAPIQGLEPRGHALRNRRLAWGTAMGRIGRAGSLENPGFTPTAGEKALFDRAARAARENPHPSQVTTPDAIPRGPGQIWDNPDTVHREIGNVIQFDTNTDVIGRPALARFGDDRPIHNVPERIILPKEQGRRAIETGHVLPAYHATDAVVDFHSFKPFSHFGTQKAAAQRLRAETGIPYDTQPPTGFEGYHIPAPSTPLRRDSAGHRTFPVLIRGKMFDMPDMGAVWSPADVAFYARAQGVIPREVAENTAIIYASGRPGSAHKDLAERYITNELRKRGYTGARYRNNVEDQGSMSYLILDPSDIRSPWAKFDTNRLGDPDLLAGVAGMGMSGAMAEALRQRQTELRGGGER